MQSTAKFALAGSLLLFPALASLGKPSIETYAITDTGVALRWGAFEPKGGGQHPAILVLHAGGFKTGVGGPQHVAEELSRAGFFALATEYRLAPPHNEMNSPEHPPPAQNTVSPVDDGHYPEQTNDIRTAIRTARHDPRCNGLVYCIGGSAGASHAVYMAGRGKPGDDQPDLIVCMSGPYDFANKKHLETPCEPMETCFWDSLLNYLDIPDFANHRAELEEASPLTYVNANFPPAFILVAQNDASQLRLFDFTRILEKFNAVGLTESVANHPERGKYKQWVVPTGTDTLHAFDYWETARPIIIDWLQAGPPQ